MHSSEFDCWRILGISSAGRNASDTKSTFKKAILLIALAIQFKVFGGTVITNDLPPNTAIINIDARSDGAANYNGDQSLWYQPFNLNGAAQLLTYTVAPGNYSFRVINPADAAQMFPGLTSVQTGQIFTAWTFNVPWTTDYLVFDSSATTNAAMPQLFDGAFSNTNGGSGNWTFYSDAGDAYSAAISSGFYNLIRTAATGGRDSTNDTTTYAFATTAILIFAVPDYALSDNSGGVSVLISPTPAVPEGAVITGINLAGPNVTLTATNGRAGNTYVTLMSTNLALSLIQWTPVATNVLNAEGSFTISTVNAVIPKPAQRFYVLRYGQ